jgi:hypothetical protein
MMLRQLDSPGNGRQVFSLSGPSPIQRVIYTDAADRDHGNFVKIVMAVMPR